MNFIENIKEGLRSIKANLLRSVLTALIVTLGITALVGILSAIDGVEQSVTASLSSLGLNAFDITSIRNRGANRQGVVEKRYPQLKFVEVERFVKSYNVNASVSLFAYVTMSAEVKHLSKKSQPNVRVASVNDEYLAVKALEIELGRNFSMIEIQRGVPVVVLGHNVVSTIFQEREEKIGSSVTFLGSQFKVIGVLKEKGQFAEDNYDNMAFIPIILGNQLADGNSLQYNITVAVDNPSTFDYAMGEATGLMRNIRRDKIGEDNSFQIEKSDRLEQNLSKITNGTYWGGIIISFVTLLGAAIALMNIMLVSVTERTREVGVRKALGATPQKIRQQFMIEAIVVCVIGGIAGVFLGIILGNLGAKFLGAAKFIVPWVWILIGLIVCVTVGLISGYYPAHKASKLDPIESLRFE